MSVFVNRSLNLKHIKYIGLDMDHTLVRYHTERFEGLAYKVTLQRLVRDLKYPQSILDLEFDYLRAIRGLVIDKAGGNLLKLSRFGATRVSYHGLDSIDFSARGDIFKNKYIDLGDSQFDPVDTAFSISFATLFSQLVDLKDKGVKGLPDYSQLAVDINRTLDRTHHDGTLKAVVSQNLEDYIIKDKEVVEGIERFIKHGKKILIITNSDYDYTRVLLDYAINPFLKDHETWLDLFEYVITYSQKPRFFYDKLNFLKVDPRTGVMTNMYEPLKPGLYQGGCASTLNQDLNLNPNEILYVGDHIYSDILRLKKACAWRTGVIVEELENEIAMNERAAKVKYQISQLMDRKRPLEEKIDDLISKQLEHNQKADSAEIDKTQHQINELDRQIVPLIRTQRKFFNPYWGEVMKAGFEESYFAHQVERFACVYMGKLADFFSNSPRAVFKAPHRVLPHELE